MVELALSAERPFDAIVVHLQSRFYRDNVKREFLESRLAKRGVAVISVSQPRPTDDTTAYLIRNVIGIIDEFQSRENSKTVRGRQRKSAEHGYFNGSRPPSSYVSVATEVRARSGFKERLQVCPEEAELVRKIFNLAEFGEGGVEIGMKRIAQTLNKEGVQYRGRKFTSQHIERVLKNRVYLGEYISFKRDRKNARMRPESEWVRTCVPSILAAPEQFDRIQQSLAGRRLSNIESKSTQVSTLLTGLLVCGFCGRGLALATGKSGRYKYYKCATKLKIGPAECDCPNLPKEEFEDLVLKTVADEVITPDKIGAMLAALKEVWGKAIEPNRRRLLALQRSEVDQQERVRVLYEQISDGKLELDSSFQETIRTMQAKLRTIHQEVLLLKSKQQLPFKKFGEGQLQSFVEAAKSALLHGEHPKAKAFLRAVVTQIRVEATRCRVRGAEL